MAENNWKMWIPHYNLENKYFICKAVDDEDGLQLFLISNDYTKKICVQFPGMVYAYRNRLELAALCTLDEITDKTGAFKAADWTFFVVENSIYAKEIAKESQDIYPFSQLIHFAIVGGQALFEVITDALPIITEGWEFSPEDIRPYSNLVLLHRRYLPLLTDQDAAALKSICKQLTVTRKQLTEINNLRTAAKLAAI